MFFPNILPEHRQHWLLSAGLLRARTFKFHFGPIHQRVWYCHWILLLSVHCTTLKSHLSPWPDLISKDFLRIILRPVTQLEWGASLVFSLGWGSYCPWVIWTRASPPPFFLMWYLNLFMFDWRIIALQSCVGITVLTTHQHESAVGLLMSPPTWTEGLF